MRPTRTLRLAGALLATTMTLAACGGSDDPAITDVAAEEPTSEETAVEDDEPTDAASGTVAFEHLAGTTEVPVDPQRIVTLSDQNALLPLLELGVEPVASAGRLLEDGTGIFRRVESYDTSDITFVGDFLEPDLEAIAGAQPDLIVGYEFNEEIYDQLSQIAPTVLVQIFDRPFLGALEDFSVLVGREDRHAELLASYEDNVAALVADLPRPPDEIVLSDVRFGGDGTFYTDRGQAVGTVLEDVGFARPEDEAAALADADYSYAESVELLSGRGGADVMLTADFSADGDGEATEIAEMREMPVFQNLDVVERGEFHVFDGGAMVGSAFEKMNNFLGFLRETLVEREPALTPAG